MDISEALPLDATGRVLLVEDDEGLANLIGDYLGRHPACPGGCLGHRFDHPKWVYRAIEWWDRRRSLRGHCLRSFSRPYPV